MISLVDRPGCGPRGAGAQQRRLPLWHKRLAEIIDLAKNLDDPIQHHRLRHSAMTAYLKKLFSHNSLVARKPLIRVMVDCRWARGFDCRATPTASSGIGQRRSVVVSKSLAMPLAHPKDALSGRQRRLAVAKGIERRVALSSWFIQVAHTRGAKASTATTWLTSHARSKCT